MVFLFMLISHSLKDSSFMIFLKNIMILIWQKKLPASDESIRRTGSSESIILEKACQAAFLQQV